MKQYARAAAGHPRRAQPRLPVEWWAQLLPQPYGWPVAGALLVAPADVDRVDAPGALRGFAPAPAMPLPFASIVVASADDPRMAVERAHSLATRRGSRFVEAGPLGHINAASGIGDWPAGHALLDELVTAAGAGGRAPVGWADAVLAKQPDVRHARV